MERKKERSVTLTMDNMTAVVWANRTERRISQKDLQKIIKDHLRELADMYNKFTDASDFTNNGMDVIAKEISERLKTLIVTGGNQMVSVSASEDDVSIALIEMSKEGFFEGGPTGFLVVDVKGSLTEFKLKTGVRTKTRYE